jgi:tetratricopeptide (TPR) repeat protein/transglutaminase-like putative cysteine protease
MRTSRRFALLVPLWVVFAGQIYAAEWPVARGPSREPQPYRFDAELWKQAPKEFLDDAPACVLYSGTSYLVEANGDTEAITHEITRFSGRKAIEKLGEYRNITFDPTFQKLTLNEACVHKANGRLVQIEPQHVQLRDMSTDYLVYDHEKQLIISFPSLEVGDTIEVKWTVRGQHPEYAGHFFTVYNFGDDNTPVLRDELRVRLAKTRTLKHAAIGGKIEPTVSEEGDQRLYVWRATNRPRLPQDENLPSKEEFRLQVSCSTFSSWDEIGAWKRQLRAACWDCAPEIKPIVQEVTRDLQTPLEKVRALTYWVRRNIRYVSAGEKHDFTPHTPSVVFANRFGDCKDQSQLLAAMLRDAGIPVSLVTLGTLDDGQVLEQVPSPWGTHAILLVTLDGQEHWIDTTLSVGAWDYLPRDDRDRLCYLIDVPAKPGAPPCRLVRTPRITRGDNRIEQETHVHVGADGSSRCERTSLFYGAAALLQRELWLEVPPGERRRGVTNELLDAHSRARLVRLAIDEKKLNDFDQPVVARTVFDVPAHFSGDSDREGSVQDNKLWSKLLSFNLDEDRTTPLNLLTPFESHHRFIVHLPPAYRVDDAPRDYEFKSEFGEFTLKATADNPREIEIDCRTRLDQPRIDPSRLEEFRRFQDSVSKHYRVWLTLKPATTLEDAPALEALVATAPSDVASSTILAKLYDKNDRKGDARRILERVRHYRPDDASLWELSVSVTDDAKEKHALYREMLRRFPEEPKYGVALATSLIDHGNDAEARTVLEKLTNADTPAIAAEVYFQLARGAFRQNQPAKALKHLEKAHETDAETVTTAAALYLKGQILEKLKQPEEAAAAYEEALDVDPEAVEPLAALITLEILADQRTEALDDVRRFTVLAGTADQLLAAAEFYLRLKKLDDAAELATRAQKERADARSERLLGRVALEQGNYEQAVAHLEKADADAEVLAGLIRGSLASGGLQDAVRYARQAEPLANSTEALRQLVRRTHELERRRTLIVNQVQVPAKKAAARERAAAALVCAEYAQTEGLPATQIEGLLNTAFAQNVELGPAFALRAALEVEKGRLIKALADAERAVALCPLEARGYYVRGRVRLERGAAGAEADLGKAVELSSHKDAAALHWLAAALAQSGRVAEALEAQREAVRLKPQDEEIAEQLRELEKVRTTRQ